MWKIGARCTRVPSIVAWDGYELPERGLQSPKSLLLGAGAGTCCVEIQLMKVSANVVDPRSCEC